MTAWSWDGCANLYVQRIGYYAVAYGLLPQRGFRYALGRIPLEEHGTGDRSIERRGSCTPPVPRPKHMLHAVITGRALDSAGQAIPGRHVEVFCNLYRFRADAPWASTTTDSTGSFTAPLSIPKGLRDAIANAADAPCSVVANVRVEAPTAGFRVVRVPLPGLRVRNGRVQIGDIVLPHQ
jgi:hypothetical protein